METKLVTIREDRPDREAIRRAGETLRGGGLVAFPTETVYGLGGDALNPESSRKIYAAKGRPSDNPLIVHVASLEEVAPLVREIPEEALLLPLHGSLSPAEQDRALQPAPPGRRKVVLATNIAESSLTIDGVTLVVDSGLERRLRYSPAAGISFL